MFKIYPRNVNQTMPVGGDEIRWKAWGYEPPLKAMKFY